MKWLHKIQRETLFPLSLFTASVIQSRFSIRSFSSHRLGSKWSRLRKVTRQMIVYLASRACVVSILLLEFGLDFLMEKTGYFPVLNFYTCDWWKRGCNIFYPNTLQNTNTWSQFIVSSLWLGYVLIDRTPPYITRLEAPKQGLAYIELLIVKIDCGEQNPKKIVNTIF